MIIHWHVDVDARTLIHFQQGYCARIIVSIVSFHQKSVAPFIPTAQGKLTHTLESWTGGVYELYVSCFSQHRNVCYKIA
jgi:hypothetical protein